MSVYMFEVQKSSEMKLLGMFSGSSVVCHTGYLT